MNEERTGERRQIEAGEDESENESKTENNIGRAGGSRVFLSRSCRVRIQIHRLVSSVSFS